MAVPPGVSGAGGVASFLFAPEGGFRPAAQVFRRLKQRLVAFKVSDGPQGLDKIEIVECGRDRRIVCLISIQAVDPFAEVPGLGFREAWRWLEKSVLRGACNEAPDRVQNFIHSGLMPRRSTALLPE